MPRRQDQLSKLSSTVLICIATGNSMPSWGSGAVKNKEICMDMMALHTIQMGTAVLYTNLLMSHETKNLFLDFCIRMQTIAVLLNKSVQLASVLFVSQVRKFLSCFCCFKRLVRTLSSNRSVLNVTDSELEPNMKLDLSHFPLHLEGEEQSIKLIMNSCQATDHWNCRVTKKQPKFLIQLLQKSTMSQGFKRIRI
uniref:Uncharacterized protein n=1 Tax=Nelumbo nucifera TaxID=4432 RepID=A0A822XHL6_NELNU|nr:TPA_asm: hypothetical protein HUJ06_020002 [Nelumbo nucifera]